MKILVLLLACLCISGIANSQGQKKFIIQGTVIDSSSRRPVEFATITLLPIGIAKPLTGTITDATGKFSLDDAAEGTFTLLIESIGHQPFSIHDLVIAGTDKSRDLGTFSLRSSGKTMDAVVVTAQAKVIEHKIDRMVFNAEKDISSQTGTASDVLKKVPQVSVDVDGNVQLAGSGGVRFLINGKPSTAFGSSIADVLQSIPASQIKSIEVISNPGARYDAQGMGGIINIILKASKTKGYNGNLSLTAGTLQQNGSFNFNVRNNNFGMNAFVSGSARLPATVLFHSERNTANGTTIDYLEQDGRSRFQRHGYQSGIGFDWTVKKYNSFSGAVSYNEFGSKGKGSTFQQLDVDKNGGPAPVFTQINSLARPKFHNTDLSFNYKRTFPKDGRELDLEVNSSIGNGRTITSNEQYAYPQSVLSTGTESNNPGKTVSTQLSADYTEPVSEDLVLGTGVKLSIDDINSSSSALKYDDVSKKYTPDNSLSSSLRYHQKVYAAYAELSFPLFAGIAGKAGGRYERTETDAFFSNAQQQQNVPGYNTFVPSFYLNKKLDDHQSLTLSYSKRIERPDYNELNPFVNTTDPKNLSTGNPGLVPETSKRLALNYNIDFGKKGSAGIGMFYRVNENDIQSYALYYPSYTVGDSVYTNVSVTTDQNIGTEKDFGANFFGDMHPTSKLGLRGNFFIFRRHTINVIDEGFDAKSYFCRINLNVTYQFAPTLVAEYFQNFNSRRREAQGTNPAFISYTFAMRKQFWNKNGSIALTANNFFAKYVDQRTRLFGPGYDAVRLRQIPFRSIGINFTWKFGKLEFKKNNREETNQLLEAN
ncbi:outer membrane beta-barrel family protein [Ferruginibacter sp. HRS2-29]|uniref:outer membrane beta-barrel family protein n=1 Tax=Ferruginibacter sp. HRS2-29 TaxID=2487334 RepID=UPI0020CBABA4|nr:outer membrane beta-barrel family protein [Ferruginibacter sp. HRS2-29]MCP9752065.1 TonB-dependent receptor [Ferruginibacter sp. HRS2-29]